MAIQLVLFSADRYHDPRVAADRARERSLAKLRPIRRAQLLQPEPAGIVVQLRAPVDARRGAALRARRAA